MKPQASRIFQALPERSVSASSRGLPASGCRAGVVSFTVFIGVVSVCGIIGFVSDVAIVNPS